MKIEDDNAPPPPKFFPLGESALSIDFGDVISPAVSRRVLALERYFEENKFAGLREMLPAYSSLAIFYDGNAVKRHYANFSTAFDAVKSLAENALRSQAGAPEGGGRLFEIPVSFGPEFAPDLEDVARLNGLKPAQVVEFFTRREYRVYMLGFLPGFAYLGEVDARIAAPRRASPRAQVSKGSVGIAGRQTGIYPLDSPGGWQIIGRTETEMFTPNAENPSLLQVGDAVRFYRIGRGA